MVRGLTVRLYPTVDQEILINKTFGCCRQIYNLHLNERNEYWAKYNQVPKEERPKLKPTTEKQWKEQFPYMGEVSSAALQQSRRDCDSAFDNWYKTCKGLTTGKWGHPKFKSKKTNYKSYRESIPSKTCLDFDHRMLTIPKLGKVRFRLRSKPKNFIIKSIKNITVKKLPSGKYYASLCCEVEHKESSYRHENQMSAIGLDWSPKLLFVSSNGDTGVDYGYKAFKQLASKKLERLQRRMMKKVAGSHNRNKARIKVARLEEHIANQRKDFQEKLALTLLKKYEIIGIENLNMKAMSKLLSNAKNVVDSSWGSFVSILERKASRFNSVIIKAGKNFPSTKLCSNCGYKNEKLTLETRKWTCPSCGKKHNRDINAAVNLRNNALSTLGSRGFQACGDSYLCETSKAIIEVNQATSVKQERSQVIATQNGNDL